MSTHIDAATPSQRTFLSALRDRPWCVAIDQFLRSPWFILLVGILTVLSAAFSLELVTYSCFVLIAVFVFLLGSDLLPITPMIALSYVAPAIVNNPGLNGNSVFSGARGVYIICLAGILIVSLIIRLCTDPAIGQKAFFTCKRSLLPGIFALGAAYMLGGAFSGYYTATGFRNALFAFIQFVSIFLFYFLLTGGIQWQQAPKNYLAWSGICLGAVILAQIGILYVTNQVLVDGQITLDRIYTGWGNRNNIGTMLAITVPFVFWMACESKHRWLYELIAIVFIGGVVATCSRGSILTVGCIYILCYVALLCKRPLNKLGWFIRIGIVVVAGLTAFLLFREKIMDVFASLIARGLNPSNRDIIYEEGIKQFFRVPIFGGSFFPIDFKPFEFSNQAAFTSFFPPRWHNTIVQLLASCGSVGLLAYLYHRFQTVKLFLRKPSIGKIFIGLSILALLGASMVDCHFFNVGPTLLYSVCLAYAEKSVQ